MKELKILRAALTALFLLGSLAAQAQKHTISGYITDAASGEPIIGAAILEDGTSNGTVTGNSGFYSLSLEHGRRVLLVTCLGYSDSRKEVMLEDNIVLNVRLEAFADRLAESVVTAHRSVTGAKGIQMSAIEVPISQIKTIPAIGGEVDVIKALQLLPGVQNGTEGTAGIYVRGGGADENLLLMDGVPLYNVNHLFGFFSVFNADALKNVTLYKGNFPARFGGHLSSVIDVRMNDGNETEYHGSASIGLISSKLNLEGPIVKGRTTFNISARRTYLDLLARPVLAYVNRENVYDERNYEKYMGGYDFYDLNVKLTHRFKGGDRLSLCVYDGDDWAHINVETADSYEIRDWDWATGTSTPTGDWNISRNKTAIGWKWGNLVSSLRWNHAAGPKLYMTAAASYTRYRSHLALSMDDYGSEIISGVEQNIAKTLAGMGYNSLINDLSGTVDFDWHPSIEHDVKFGAVLTSHSFKPGIISLQQKYSDSANPEDNIDISTKVGDTPMHSLETALYGEDNWSVTPWLKVNAGLRTSLYNVASRTYLSAEPRLSARALLTDKLSVKASYSEMSQYIHLLCNSSLSLPSDLWVPVTKQIKPMRSRQGAAGVFYDMGGYEFSVEGYLKGMSNVLEYKDGASYFGTSTGWEEKVCMGRGRAYGVEFFAQKKMGRTTGWIGYTLAKSDRMFDRPGNIINDGRPFPAKYDRRHDISATVTHSFSKKFDLSATFVYASGNCGTLGLEDYVTETLSGSGATSGLHYDYGSASYIPNRNNYRMPSYNRMDIGANFYKQRRHGTRIWNISVYNAYNRLNPFLVTTDMHYEYDEKTGVATSWPVLKKISIFPIIPSFSYTFKF